MKDTQIIKWTKQNKLAKIKLCDQNKRKPQTSNSYLTQKKKINTNTKKELFFSFFSVPATSASVSYAICKLFFLAEIISKIKI